MYDEKQCRFAASHEWAFAEGDVITVGISDYAQKEISDIVFVELPKAGAAVTQGKACAVIESVKAAADFMAPASGEVIEVNDALVDNPALVNQSPHGEGWFFKIRMSTPAELDTLMDFEAYQKTVQ
ncbi:MAG: glycine cleavage system protein GcvH [Opitutae bacterium]|jgi:glycine cleavage system H protein|nr:glycine cleavage system protein GcvH [Kiritimatiellia bacterium]NCC93986.1 glycine cleavage system protein GcvH [Opitutae bacterium]